MNYLKTFLKTIKEKRTSRNSQVISIQFLKKEEYQDGFLREIFVDVFGCILKPAENYNLAREFKKPI